MEQLERGPKEQTSMRGEAIGPVMFTQNREIQVRKLEQGSKRRKNEIVDFLRDNTERGYHLNVNKENNKKRKKHVTKDHHFMNMISSA